jgi:hypothetical protein
MFFVARPKRKVLFGADQKFNIVEARRINTLSCMQFLTAASSRLTQGKIKQFAQCTYR